MAQISAPALALLMLLSMVFFSQEASAARGGCCRRYSKGRLPFSLIKGYSIQTVTKECNLNAVLFHTKKNRDVCVDPSQGWVMESIRKLREEVQAMKSKRSTGQ